MAPAPALWATAHRVDCRWHGDDAAPPQPPWATARGVDGCARVLGWLDGMMGMKTKGPRDVDNVSWALLGQHHQISQNGCRVGSTRIQGQMRWDWWGDHDQIRSGTVRGQLVEMGMSHQIWWNIIREHNWGVPSAHIMFIYYVTYILECLIMLWGHMHTGMYTIL